MMCHWNDYREHKRAGRIEDAIDIGLTMLSICDEDPALHRQVFEFGTILGFSSERWQYDVENISNSQKQTNYNNL